MNYIEDDLTGCWIWQGRLNTKGYPTIGVDLAHRRMWIQRNGPIPAGMELHHTCEERSCVNPDHLEAVDQNLHKHEHGVRRNADREVCINGHPWQENVVEYTNSDGSIARVCRLCIREHNNQSYRNQKLRKALRQWKM